jgi:6-phosphofructokinase 1
MEMVTKRIGILTGGGDVPGLNAVIKSVTYRGSENDIEVVGLRRGWEALTHVNLEDPASRSHYIIPLNRDNTRTIDRSGGTVLHSSRTNPSKMKKLPDHLVGRDFPALLSTKSGNQDVGRHHPGAGEPLGARHRTPDRHRRRRHARVCGQA